MRVITANGEIRGAGLIGPTGPSGGPTGPTGPIGPVGGLTIPLVFSTTQSAPPSAGEVRANAVLSSATTLWISDTDAASGNIDGFLDQLGVGDKISIFSRDGNNFLAIFSITSITDSGTYHTLVVSNVLNEGVAGPVNGEPTGLGLAQKGATGATGPTGLTGPSGPVGPVGGLTIPFLFSEEASAPPDTGRIRTNLGGSVGSATILWISDTDRFGGDLDAFLDAVAVGDKLSLFAADGADVLAIYVVTSVVDSGTYHTIGVTVQVTHGVSGLSEDQPVGLGIAPRGATGQIGPVGGLTIPFLFSEEASAPPDTGRIRTNLGGSVGSATILWISDTDDFGGDLDAFLDALAVGDRLSLFAVDGGDAFAIYTVTSVTDSGAC